LWGKYSANGKKVDKLGSVDTANFCNEALAVFFISNGFNKTLFKLYFNKKNAIIVFRYIIPTYQR